MVIILNIGEEIEFDYPSNEFFEQLERTACSLQLAREKDAIETIATTESPWAKQQRSSLMARLKVEIARDFEKHEAEPESIPYFAKYLLCLEKVRSSYCLSVRTALCSKYGHEGRVLYGSSIFRIGEDLFISENCYGD
jgi:hypothetical protein